MADANAVRTGFLNWWRGFLGVYLSPKSYACYDLEARAGEAPSSSPEDAGRKIRAGLEASGKRLGTSRKKKKTEPMPLDYGHGFGMNVRFKTRSGDAPVLRLLWRRENGACPGNLLRGRTALRRTRWTSS